MDYRKAKNKAYTGALIINCANCKESFKSFPSDKRKYCSKDCYLRHHRADWQVCLGCRMTFKVKGCPHQKYCSRDCYFTNTKPWNTGLLNAQPKLLGKEHPGIKKRMRELGISWLEYNNWKEDKQRYYKEVWRITNQQPLYLLPNFDKPRGRAGSANAYQLDHIVSISNGFKNQIDPEVIGSIQNLQFIPWLENIQKQ